ncbi:MAG: integrin alpha, partial [Polyangia bacterium]
EEEGFWIEVLAGRPDLEGTVQEQDMLVRVSHPGESSWDQLKLNPFGPGDVNGDGYADFGFTRFGNLGVDGWVVDPLGAVYLVYGGPDLPSEMDAEQADVKIVGNGDPWFGEYASGVGDVNGDGLMDFAVSATGSDIESEIDEFPGRVFVFFGGPTLEDKQTADDADLIISSTIPDETKLEESIPFTALQFRVVEPPRRR